MNAHQLQERLSDSEAKVHELCGELIETNHGLLALAMELEQRLDERRADLRASHAELAETNSELMQLTLEMEDRVAERTAELSQANEALRREISEHERAEEDLKRAKSVAEEASRVKDQFIAVMSHELRTPLTPILAIISALDSQQETGDEVRAKREMIQRNLELEVRLIDDLLDLNRISQGKVELHPRVVDANSCLRGAVEMCRADIDAAQLAISLSLEAARHEVQADPARLQQVFWNLLKNAIKFTPPQGGIWIASSNEGDWFKVQISDTGIGIEPELLPRIFNSFEQAERTRTRRFGGLGLGLTIARSLVEKHGGRLTACSEGKNKGATFTVELTTLAPLPIQNQSPPEPEPERERTPSFEILLVDDHPDTLRILASLLRRNGYCVTPADCVQSALETASRQHFDLLVSDLGLPDGSGMDIMRRVKEQYGIRGIAISGFGTEEDIRQSRIAGFEEHLVKPVNFDALRAAIRHVVPEAA